MRWPSGRTQLAVPRRRRTTARFRSYHFHRLCGHLQPSWKAHREARAAGAGFHVDGPFQGLGDDVVDDMQAQSRTASGTACGEEGVVDAIDITFQNAASIIAERQVNGFSLEQTRAQDDVASLPVRVGMNNAVDNEVGDDLRQGPREPDNLDR